MDHPLKPGVTRIVTQWLGPWRQVVHGERRLLDAVEETMRREAGRTDGGSR